MVIYNSLKHPTRLYIKKCSHCGLKYFGKSTLETIESYRGSGLKWRRHLVKYKSKAIHIWNSDWFYDESIIEIANQFSLENNIVESDEWANLKLENGIDGGSNKGSRGPQKNPRGKTNKPAWNTGKKYSNGPQKNPPPSRFNKRGPNKNKSKKYEYINPHPNSKSVIINNIKYNSLNEASRILQISIYQVRKIKNNLKS